MSSRARIGVHNGEDWLIHDNSGTHMRRFWSMVGWSSVAIGVLCLTLLGRTVQADAHILAFGVGDPECDRSIPHCE